MRVYLVIIDETEEALVAFLTGLHLTPAALSVAIPFLGRARARARCGTGAT